MGGHHDQFGGWKFSMAGLLEEQEFFAEFLQWIENHVGSEVTEDDLS